MTGELEAFDSKMLALIKDNLNRFTNDDFVHTAMFKSSSFEAAKYEMERKDFQPHRVHQIARSSFRQMANQFHQIRTLDVQSEALTIQTQRLLESLVNKMLTELEREL